MRKSIEFSPKWVSPPGDTMRDALRERGITLANFAGLLEQTPEETTDLLSGRSAITIRLARRLEKALGGSVEFWMSRDFQYRRQLGSSSVENDWLRDLPIADMVALGWITPGPRRSEELATCLRFFGVPNVAAWHRAYGNVEERFSFRTSASLESKPAAVAAWLRRGEIEAASIQCAPWDPASFESSLASIRSLTRQEDPELFVPVLRRICAESGVALAIVRCPSGCRASGATRFITKDKALLMLSFRYMSDDQFWFSLFHEAGHLLLHGQRLFIEGIGASNTPVEETEANEFAAQVLVPVQHRLELLNLGRSPFGIARFARRIGISTGVVVGQLQHYGQIKPNHFNHLKRRYTWG